LDGQKCNSKNVIQEIFSHRSLEEVKLIISLIFRFFEFFQIDRLSFYYRQYSNCTVDPRYNPESLDRIKVSFYLLSLKALSWLNYKIVRINESRWHS
jgi:hypothetical protein